MNRRIRIAASVVVLAVAAVFTAAAVSAESGAAGAITEEEATQKALSLVPGEVLEVEIEDEGQGDVWNVEIRDGSGQVNEVQIDLDTGQVLGSEVESEDNDDD